MSDLFGNPERTSRDAAQIIIKPLNVLLLKMFYYSIVSSHRAVMADNKVAPVMPHANFRGGFWKIKIWVKRSLPLPILYQKTFKKSSAFLREGKSIICIKSYATEITSR